MKKRFLQLFVLLVACIVLCGCETPVSRWIDRPNPYVCVRQANADGSYLTYDYDGEGNRTQETAYIADGTVQYRTEYKYSDDSGWMVEESRYAADDTLEWRAELEYNGGMCISRTTYGADGTQTQAVKTDYGENDWSVKECTYDADNELTAWCDISRDENGNETRRVFHFSDGSPDLVTEFEYDGNGNNTKITSYTGDICTGWHELTYDDDNRKSSDTQYSADGTEECTWHYTYAKNSGDVLQVDVTGSDTPLYEYEYLRLSEYRKRN